MKLIHGGKIGDVIYSIPTAKRLSQKSGQKIEYILHKGREWKENAAKAVRPLLEAQSFIEKVSIDFSGPSIYFDRENENKWKEFWPDASYCFDQFRFGVGIAPHLAIGQALHIGVTPDLSLPWLDQHRKTRTNKIVFHPHRELYTGKSIQPKERFQRLLEDQEVIVIGTESDIHDCDPLNMCKSLEYIQTKNILEAAEIIAASSVFIGGDHSPLALAVGTHTPTIAEVFSPLRNTIPLMPDHMWMDMQFHSDKDLKDFIELWTNIQ